MATFSYSFTTVDATPPQITAVIGRTLGTVRVTFDEDMGSDALLAASYSLALVTGDSQTRHPAVRGQDVAISAVTKIDDNVYDLTLDMELTPRATYTLATTASDTSGNASVDSSNFTGYQPYVDPDRVYDYLAWIPDINLAEDGDLDLTNVVLALQEVGELLLYEADKFPEYLDPDTAPEAFVDAMLHDLGNPFDFDFTLTEKRVLAKLLKPIYNQKGTDVGIINAIRLLMGIEVTITSPYKTGAYLGVTSVIGTTWVLSTSVIADLYTFVVNVPVQLSTEQTSKMNRIIAFMRRAPCHWRIAAPTTTTSPDHWAMGFSKLGTESFLH